MTREEFNAICGAFPATTVHASFGPDHDVWKVGDKMFALMGAEGNGIVLKCADPETAAMLIEIGVAETFKYLPRGGWIFVPTGTMPVDDLAGRLEVAYQTVRSSLTKSRQAALDYP